MYRGSEKSSMVKTAVVAADILQKEIDVKLLVGCSKAEEDLILRFLNQTDFQKTILIRRGNEIPEWGLTVKERGQRALFFFLPKISKNARKWAPEEMNEI